jgi:hypothetical protein
LWCCLCCKHHADKDCMLSWESLSDCSLFSNWCSLKTDII